MQNSDNENISTLYKVLNRKPYQDTKSYVSTKKFEPDTKLISKKYEFVVDKKIHPDTEIEFNKDDN